ncbi:hypothetical protein [Haploplasma axanthum]|nr:hypothetical protein [Haploplasma axanthum]
MLSIKEYEVITLESPKYWISQNILSVEDINKMTVDQLARIYANYEKY